MYDYLGLGSRDKGKGIKEKLRLVLQLAVFVTGLREQSYLKSIFDVSGSVSLAWGGYSGSHRRAMSSHLSNGFLYERVYKQRSEMKSCVGKSRGQNGTVCGSEDEEMFHS